MKPRIIALFLFGIALVSLSAAPALAWWQFAAWQPNGERQVHRFSSEKACEAALKQTDVQLAKKYPKLFPRVGSCEEYK
jgi:hypothetical protein